MNAVRYLGIVIPSVIITNSQRLVLPIDHWKVGILHEILNVTKLVVNGEEIVHCYAGAHLDPESSEAIRTCSRGTIQTGQ